MFNTLLIIAVLIFLSILTRQRVDERQPSKGLLSISTTNCLRGIAILMIMVGHISGTMNTVVYSPLASTGVTLFLILSGYGLNESYKRKGLESFWKKKFLRVLLPYSFVFISLAVYKRDWSPLYWILNLSGLETSYWFIAFIVRCYIIFWLSSILLHEYRIRLMCLMSLGLFFMGNGLEAPQAISFVVGVIISNSASCLQKKLHLCNGRLYLSSSQTREDKRFLISLLFIGLTVGTVFLALKQLPYLRSEFNGTHFYDLIQMMINVPYAFVVIAFVMVFQGVATSRFLQLGGSISYELYLVHFPFYGSVQGNMLYVVVFFIGTFLAAWIYKQFIVFLESNIQLKSFKAKS